MRLFLMSICVMTLTGAASSSVRADSVIHQASSLAIVVNASQGEGVMRVADMLKKRIEQRSVVSVETIKRPGRDDGFRVYLGCAGNTGELAELCEAHGVELPGTAAQPIRRYMDFIFARRSFQESLTDLEQEMRQ